MTTDQAYNYLLNGEYEKAAQLYEKEISEDPTTRDNYWYLGLSMLLNEQELEAQLTWGMVISNGSAYEEEDLWTNELCDILKQEAIRQEELKEYATAWLIRQHIREIIPNDFDNLVQIIYLSLHLKTLTPESLEELGIIKLLKTTPSSIVIESSVLQLIQNILNSKLEYSLSLDLISSCIPHIKQTSQQCIDLLLPVANKIGTNNITVTKQITEMCLQIDPQNIQVLGYLVDFYSSNQQYSEAIDLARSWLTDNRSDLPRQIATQYLLLYSLMSAGINWDEAEKTWETHESLLLALAQQRSDSINIYLCLGRFFTPYFKDNPQVTRPIQNQVVKVSQENLQNNNQRSIIRHERKAPRTEPLRIGYISASLRSHSVGWLSRGLFQHHDLDKFQIYGYFLEYMMGKDSLQEWYVNQVTKAYKDKIDCPSGNIIDLIEQIHRDQIDILIDLDSLTSVTCCDVMALKPAPIQATWLGLDASGLPAIDYFIADQYVLPANAQEYYSEKIWRLPNSYISIDGFEVGVPTIHRRDFDIPNDAVIYLTAQKGFKRHPQTLRLQMQIIKSVPNSYFLIKGLADQQATQSLFLEIAEQEGVSADRLKFLGITKSEAEHRANLAIADVVLDTYPYNGATTTMETLWMCIPLVTRVGEQFASRNSYTMMVNAGLTEGIAWNDQEYVDWGVRLGNDEALRKQIFWKLRESRKTSPLWNAKQFTREMESAYEKMWEIYNS